MKKIAVFSVGLVLGITVMLVMAATYATVLPGTIYHVYPVYKDSDTITIKPGYGECNGHYFDIVSDTDHDMTSLASGEDFHYIYVDDSASNYPDATIIDSTTEPSWSDSKLGWYNGDDRCIGVVWSPSDSSTIGDFKCNSHQKYLTTDGAYAMLLSLGNPNGTYQTLEATAYFPVNAIGLSILANNSDTGDKVSVFVVPYENMNARLIAQSYEYAYGFAWLDLERNCSRDLKWYGEDNDNNGFNIWACGYQIER